MLRNRSPGPQADDPFRDPHIAQQPSGKWQVVGRCMLQREREAEYDTPEEAETAMEFAQEFADKLRCG